MPTTLRVGAVGNAFFAFSKECVDAFSASTAPTASTRRSDLSPSSRRGNSPGAFIESSQPNRAEVEIPFAIINRFEPNRFTDQHRTDDRGSRVPPHHAGRRDTAELVMPRIFKGAQAARQPARRRDVEPIGPLLSESFMRPFVIVATTESRKATPPTG